MRASSASLRRQLLIWLLIPSLLLWLVGAAVTYSVALRFSKGAYDRNLLDGARALAQQVHAVNGRIVVDLPSVAQQILETDQYDHVFYQVQAPDGHVIAGDADISAPPLDDGPPLRPRLHNATLHYKGLRVASLYVRLPGTQPAETVLVQVAETTNKRMVLAHEILADVALPQLLLIVLAAVAVWVGVGKGLRPLERLQSAIRDRSHRDLRPLNERDSPEEVRPLIRAINDLLERLGRALAVQQRFVGDAAHQLRTPLAGLKTQTALAMREQDPENARHALHQIHTSADQLTRLVNQLLTLARAERGPDAAPSLQHLDLNALARDIASEWVPAALTKDIDLGFEGPDSSVLVQGYPLLLRELVVNLLDNAVRYGGPGGRITVTVGTDRNPTLIVDDDGPGIPMQERDRVFERFYRILGTKSEGSGLGLAIVREIAETHGATVSLDEGEAGRGVRVTVRFPAATTHRSELSPRLPYKLGIDW
jgi:two-component system sensor histidine kinase TctE